MSEAGHQEHKERQGAAHDRAAAVHDEAAVMHRDAARVFDQLGQHDLAEHERQAAGAEEQMAAESRERANRDATSRRLLWR